MPKKKADNAKHFAPEGRKPSASEKRAAAAFDRMHREDRASVNFPIAFGFGTLDELKARRNRDIKKLAGAPGAYTTKRGGKILNSRKKKKKPGSK